MRDLVFQATQGVFVSARCAGCFVQSHGDVGQPGFQPVEGPLVGGRRRAIFDLVDTTGEIVDLAGRRLGAHRGLIHYTVGQRRGLEIGGTPEPLYVVRLEPETRRVVVGPRAALAVDAARIERINWLGNTAPRGMQESHGLMVNYLYERDEIERNHEAFARGGTVVRSGAVDALLAPPKALPVRKDKARPAKAS